MEKVVKVKRIPREWEIEEKRIEKRKLVVYLLISGLIVICWKYPNFRARLFKFIFRVWLSATFGFSLI